MGDCECRPLLPSETYDATRKSTWTAFTAMMVLSGIAAVGGFILAIVGIWIICDKTTDVYYVRYLTSGAYSDVTAINLIFANPIVFGLLPILPFGLAMGAAYNKNPVVARRLLLSFYFITLLITLVALPLTLATAAALTESTSSQLKDGLRALMNIEYIGLPDSWTLNRDLSLLWDRLMVRDGCCGVDGASDFLSNSAVYSTAWYANYREYRLSNGSIYQRTQVKLPLACCSVMTKSVLTTNDWWNFQNYLVNEACPVENALATNSYSTSGCHSLLYNSLYFYGNASFAVLFVLLLILNGAEVAATYIICCHKSTVMPNDPKPQPQRQTAQTKEIKEFPRHGAGYRDSNQGQGFQPSSSGQRGVITSNQNGQPPTTAYVPPQKPYQLPETYSNRMNDVYYTAAPNYH